MLKFFGKFLDLNQREVERLAKVVESVNSFEPKIKKLSDSSLSKKTDDFKKRIEKGETLESILPEAFAVVREATQRTLGMRHFDVQLMAATALFNGAVAEQKTGEGKTLSAVPALYLRALTGKGVHLVTVNDYLARRDSGWNGPIFHMLGMKVGSIVQEQKSFVYDPKYKDTSHGDERLAHLRPCDRKEAYGADITYGTNNEFGFDYLRDNMVSQTSEMVQKGHYFAIVDEVDSVLVDEARTPLIISAPDTEPTDKYYKFAELVDGLNPDTDYKIDEKSKSASLTEQGITRVEKLLKVDNLYEKDFEAIHHMENALRARTLYLRDREYVVKDGQITIVDEFTGRLMFGRRWSDGLHQAVEAKEGVQIQQESKTLATISFQNYFRMYEVLSGMTGTAATEAEEFRKIYKLEVIVIPTHRQMVRKDTADVIYKTVSAKLAAVAADIEVRYKKGQPVLVGTTSIEKNEIISDFLKRKKVPHNVLNAKNHEREAMILADAGKPGGVTVATNMAGRGVDIILGGSVPDSKDKRTIEKWKKEHEKVVKAGGLHVIGTERHESRRIDNQLRGRAGRQGDPGSSQFFLSLEDDLMRIFGGDQIKNLMDTLKIDEAQPIENGLVSRAIEQAQIKVEGFHFDTRKSLVDFDDVSNQQREIIYRLRKRILESEDIKDEILEKLGLQIEKVTLSALPVVPGLLDIIPFDDQSMKAVEAQVEKIKDKEKLKEFLIKVVRDVHAAREKQATPSVMRQIEKFAYLGAIDHLWIDHLDQIDDLREGVRLRAYGQRDPLVEFKNEAYTLFETLINRIDEEIAHRVFRISATPQQEIPLNLARENIDTSDNIGLTQKGTKKAFESHDLAHTSKVIKTKIGRNDPCWCGKKDKEGKPVKWKKCHYPQMPSN